MLLGSSKLFISVFGLVGSQGTQRTEGKDLNEDASRGRSSRKVQINLLKSIYKDKK